MDLDPLVLERLASSLGFVRAGAASAVPLGGPGFLPPGDAPVPGENGAAPGGTGYPGLKDAWLVPGPGSGRGMNGCKGRRGPDSLQLREDLEAGFSERLAKGDFSVLPWINAHEGKRYHPELLADWCRTVLVFALPVYQEDAADRNPALPGGLVARYARGRDYHKVMGKKLKRFCEELESEYPGGQWRPWVDAHPLDEVWFAQAAGLGFRGRHSLLIAGPMGSWCALGLVLTSHQVEAGLFLDRLGGGAEAVACPPSCRRCINACPTAAIHENDGQWQVNPSRCIAFLGIENRGTIPLDLRSLAGRRIFGCDACQEACPLGKRAVQTEEAAFLSPGAGALVSLGEILALPDRKAFEERFAGTPLMRPGLEGLKRNACVVAGNTRQSGLRPLLEELARGKEGTMIAEHARWALDEMDRKEAADE